MCIVFVNMFCQSVTCSKGLMLQIPIPDINGQSDIVVCPSASMGMPKCVSPKKFINRKAVTARVRTVFVHVFFCHREVIERIIAELLQKKNAPNIPPFLHASKIEALTFVHAHGLRRVREVRTHALVNYALSGAGLDTSFAP